MNAQFDQLTGDPLPHSTAQNPVDQAVTASNAQNEVIDISALTDDDLRQECKESLVMMLRRSKGDLKALGAVRELLDRIEGKPVQRTLEAKMEVGVVEKTAKKANSEKIARFLGIEWKGE